MAENRTKVRLITNNRGTNLYTNELTYVDGALKIGGASGGDVGQADAADIRVATAEQAYISLSSNQTKVPAFSASLPDGTLAEDVGPNGFPELFYVSDGSTIPVEVGYSSYASEATVARSVGHTHSGSPIPGDQIYDAVDYVDAATDGYGNFNDINGTDTNRAINYVKDATSSFGENLPGINNPLQTAATLTDYNNEVYRKTYLVARQANASTTNFPPDVITNQPYYAIRYPVLHVDYTTNLVVKLFEIAPYFGRVWYNRYTHEEQREPVDGWRGWVGYEPTLHE